MAVSILPAGGARRRECRSARPGGHAWPDGRGRRWPRRGRRRGELAALGRRGSTSSRRPSAVDVDDRLGLGLGLRLAATPRAAALRRRLVDGVRSAVDRTARPHRALDSRLTVVSTTRLRRRAGAGRSRRSTSAIEAASAGASARRCVVERRRVVRGSARRRRGIGQSAARLGRASTAPPPSRASPAPSARSTISYVSTSLPRPAREVTDLTFELLAALGEIGRAPARASCAPRPRSPWRRARAESSASRVLTSTRLLCRGAELLGGLLRLAHDAPGVLLGLVPQLDRRLARLAEHACRLLTERGDQLLVGGGRRRLGSCSSSSRTRAASSRSRAARGRDVVDTTGGRRAPRSRRTPA